MMTAEPRLMTGREAAAYCNVTIATWAEHLVEHEAWMRNSQREKLNNCGDASGISGKTSRGPRSAPDTKKQPR